MSRQFDPRVVPSCELRLLRAIQARVGGRLGGGAALSGVHLHHRLSRDLDVFVSTKEEVRAVVTSAFEIAADADCTLEIVRDAGSFVRVRAGFGERSTELDLVHDAVPVLEPPERVEGVVVQSFRDLRAAKLTCILSRSEPRDLADLYFLDRAQYPPEGDLSLAVKMDAGIDAATLAWLLDQFPVQPLPVMLEALTIEDLDRFRRDLRDRLRRLALPPTP